MTLLLFFLLLFLSFAVFDACHPERVLTGAGVTAYIVLSWLAASWIQGGS